DLERAMAATIGAANAGLEQTTQTATLTGMLAVTAGELTSTAERTQQLAVTIDQAMALQRTSAAGIAHATTSIAEAARGMRRDTTPIAAEAGERIEVAQDLRAAALRFGMTNTTHPLRLLIAGRETVSSRGLAWRALVDAWNAERPEQGIRIEFMPPGDYH